MQGAQTHKPPHGRLAELRPAELAALLERFPVAFVPSGALEWHSYHLPIGLDGLLAEELCLRAARLGGGAVVPPTYWAIGGVPHPYTTRIDPPLIEALFARIAEQLDHLGFRCLVVLAGHYGIDHYTALKRAAAEAMRRSSLIVCALPEFELATDLGFQGGDHAGAWETSILWALHPDLVSMDRLRAEGPLEGVLGEDPRTGASQARGQAMVDQLIRRLAELAGRLAADRSPRTRSAHLDVLAAQITVLEQIRADRATRPRPLVRDLLSQPYLRHLDRFLRGDYAEARQVADEALLLLARAQPAGA